MPRQQEQSPNRDRHFTHATSDKECHRYHRHYLPDDTPSHEKKCPWIYYDEHITVQFPELGGLFGRRAHVYVGPRREGDIEKMKIWRRDGKPAIVLC